MGFQLRSATQKKQWAIRPPPFKGASLNLDLSMVFPRQRKELLAYECVALTRLRISGQFLASDRLNSLIEDRCLLLRYPTHNLFSLSLILRECRHHELSIVLTANFSAATGNEEPYVCPAPRSSWCRCLLSSPTSFGWRLTLLSFFNLASTKLSRFIANCVLKGP